jgi:hypothetical protein
MSKPKRIKVKSTVQINSYDVIRRAVEEGVAYGINRAWKHSDNPVPSPGQHEEIERAVINSLCEVIVFDMPTEEN